MLNDTDYSPNFKINYCLENCQAKVITVMAIVSSSFLLRNGTQQIFTSLIILNCYGVIVPESGKVVGMMVTGYRGAVAFNT